ncbi:MAG: DNA replication and repair protein RecF [Bacteriovoracaceae bacterium]|nr:DNA replication and repair protein RecF [Bacteriovoracaceae bacterium]
MTFKVDKLQVTNFRNLQPDIIQFSSGINCILGENGNGKTNILEAIHVLATKKSFRKNTGFPQYLGIDGEKTEILFSSVFKNEEETQMSLSAKINQDASLFFVNGKPVKRTPEIKLLFINPFDSYQFHNTAAFRRSFIDTYLGMLNPEYKKNLSKYNSALRQRNTLLKKKPSHFREMVKSFNQQLAQYGIPITKERLNFLEEIRPFCGETFKTIFSEEHDLQIVLDTRVTQLDEKFLLNMLEERRQKDEDAGHTTYCIHKDDYTLLFDGLNSFDYCSLGQQKMSYLSLLFAYIELFRYKYKSFPIVLIDDVSGELDRYRWKRLVDYLETRKFQVLITTANEKFKEELDRIEGANRIHVDAGSIIQ